MTVTNLFNKLHEAESFEKLPIHHLINKFSAFNDTWKFISVFNKAYSFKPDEPSQCIAHSISATSISVLSLHL